MSAAPHRSAAVLVCAIVLPIAALVRLWGIDFCFPHTHCRPDEDAIAALAGGFRAGEFNPHVFNYPALFMLAVGGVLRILPGAEQLLHKLMPFHFDSLLIGVSIAKKSYMTARLLSAAAGVASVWVVFRIGLRLFDRHAATAAAGLLAVAFLHVRDSHFGVTDVPMSLMVLLAFAAAVRLADSGTRTDLWLAGVAAGLAASTKYNGALVALPVLFAVCICPPATKGRPGRLAAAAMASALMVAAFLATSPYTVLDFTHFVADLASDAQHLSGGHAVNLGRGWVYHAVTTLRLGVGWPLLGAGTAGMLLMIARAPRKGVLVALFPVSYYAVLGSGYTVFTRHMTPVVPFLCLTAGHLIAESTAWITARAKRPEWRPALTGLAALAVLWPSLQSVVEFDRLIARTDSRLFARRWVEQRFASGTTIGQIGPEGGHLYLPREEPDLRYVILKTAGEGVKPDLIVVPSSPVTEPPDLRGIEPLLMSSYRLGYSRRVVAADRRNVYDLQDEFYMPFAGFHAERPGPNLDIYVRQDLQWTAPVRIDRN